MSNYAYDQEIEVKQERSASNYNDDNQSSLELTEKEMQDLADSISPLNSMDSVSSLNEMEDRTEQPAHEHEAPRCPSTNATSQEKQYNVKSEAPYKQPTKRVSSSSSRASDNSVNTGDSKNRQAWQADSAKERRRERNRLLAKKTRIKNKVEVENLRKEIEALRRENAALKQNVKEIIQSTSHRSSEAKAACVKEMVSIMEGNASAQEAAFRRAFSSQSSTHNLQYSSNQYGDSGSDSRQDQATDSAQSSLKSGTEGESSSSGQQSDSAGSDENASGSDDEKNPQKKSKSD